MRPNIVFYFTDQQRFDTCGIYGQRLPVTPRLDAFAARSVCFEQAITCQPVCGPARAALQTGRWPAAIGAVAFLALNLLTSEEIFGAKNWIYVAGFSIQPSEFVKIAYAYAGAATLDNLFRRRNVFVFVGFSALCVCALALMGDFGTALVFFVAFLVICFIRSGSVSTIILASSVANAFGWISM